MVASPFRSRLPENADDHVVSFPDRPVQGSQTIPADGVKIGSPVDQELNDLGMTMPGGLRQERMVVRPFAKVDRATIEQEADDRGISFRRREHRETNVALGQFFHVRDVTELLLQGFDVILDDGIEDGSLGPAR